MSELAEDFNALRKYKQEKRASNRASSADLLAKAGIAFDVRNDGAHLIVKAGGYVIDFWPGTGKWSTRGYRFTIVSRGVHRLMQHLKEQHP